MLSEFIKERVWCQTDCSYIQLIS